MLEISLTELKTKMGNLAQELNQSEEVTCSNFSFFAVA